ncbi:MAG: hotdog fold thioesterase, partial [Microbacteriaceae bacterium]|nr:hotdog fold thioesterase [Microbacteriaceae bacterium]
MGVPSIEVDPAAPAGALGKKMGIEVISASPELSIARMPVEGNTQPYGILHGGAHLVLAESLGSMSAHLHAGPGRYAVGIEIGASHSRSV